MSSGNLYRLIVSGSGALLLTTALRAGDSVLQPPPIHPASGKIATGIPQGSAERAERYYRGIATTLRFKDDKTILESTLDDVPRYLGYDGLSGRDLERLASAVLMDPAALGKQCDPQTPCDTAVSDATAFSRAFGVRPIRPGDILASRFLAPKIANVAEPAASRPTGWRKLVRL